MFNIYTNLESIKEENYANIIMDLEREFSKNYDFYTKDKQILQNALNIDSSTLLEDDCIKTKFGTTTIDNLATGIKGYIIICNKIKYSNGRTLISVVECGDNVISSLIPILDTQNIVDIYDIQYRRCKESFTATINDSHTINSFKEMRAIQ
jgi:hypothetical protein